MSRITCATCSRLLLLIGIWSVSNTCVAQVDPVQFNRDVRPVLAEFCYACHGPDSNTREADLRLDEQQDAKADRGGYHVILPGKPAESELIRRIVSDDPDERMPPGSIGKTLSDQQVKTLRKWIAAGAAWQQHWSLIPPTRAKPPAVDDDSLVHNEIDRFILAGLQRQDLSPSATADRRTLARRLSFDLVGLPPTPEEVDAFVSDTAAGAYERFVDRLLGSEHFGERMAVYWLDVVRYADSAGYHSDNHRDVAPYRDYVIRAFNSNLPFDQFTMEQLAGDLLPEASNRQKIASGYNRLLQTTEEGGAQPKEYTAKYLADRVRNTATAWLGVTMGCCECHDHKFDPFTMQDFYSLGAFFADLQEKAVGRQEQVAIPTAEQERELAELDSRLAPLRVEMNRSTPELEAGQAKWEARVRGELADGKLDWLTVKPDSVASSGGATLAVQDDLTVLSSGTNPAKDTYTVTFRGTGIPRLTGIRLEALTHESLTNKSLSRGNGNFVLTEVEIEVQRPDSDQPQAINVKEAIADFSQDGYPVANAIDGKPATGWAVLGHQKPADHKAVFVFAEPLDLPENATLTVRLRHDSQFAQHNVGRFRLSLTAADQPRLSDKAGLPEDVLQAMNVEPEARSDSHKQTLARHYRSIAPELEEARAQIAALLDRQEVLRKAFPKTLISVSVEPRMVRILPRGNWLDDSGEEVQPNTPGALALRATPEGRATRRDLANWLVSRDNPLVARVFVNRLWKLFFGQGIVKSLDDFGTQGNMPTHPELLDWLAVEFMESGWDVKQMVKRMVMSRTYRQSSVEAAELRQRDPANRWLARQARFRLDAEMVRDNALAISGLLSPKIGGGSVKPYQPAGYWQHLNFPKRQWQAETGDNLYRRGLYTYWQRTFLHPSLLAFDAPSREECTVERPRSNTPLQALVLLNDPTYVEAARVFAERVVGAGGDDIDERLEFAFRRALNRPPNDNERGVLAALYQKHADQYRADPPAAEALLQVGAKAAESEGELAELAAWTSVTRVILNLHETITRY